MTDKIQLHDFIEMEYTGRFKDGRIFDTTDQEIAQKNNLFSPQMRYGPAVICVGERQLVPGLDDSLVGKEAGSSYTIELKPENAFGKKDIKKIKLVPLAEFRKRKINPQPGLQIEMDGEVGTILRNSGGRILVNFNHPFAGREIVYDFKINKKIEDPKEKLDSYLELSLNSTNFQTEVKENKAVISLPVELPKEIQEEFSKKLKELTKLGEITFQKKKEEPKPSEKPNTTPKQ